MVNPIKKAAAAYQKYGFLLSQLVGRDFKTKYKRNVLGVLWSMLNPLLTMCVQYIIFSELFRWDIDNFAVYLLTGTVMFNFFTEATGQALTSITGNAALITKVYVPRYVFPLSKVLSSCINLAFSTLALYAILLLQGVPLNVHHLLLPYGYGCLIMFTAGVGMILASLMVYFRDTQFLYGIVTVLWTYLTPLFYPIDIVPDRFLFIIKCNPMFHFIRYVRNLILDNTMPTLRAHAICLLFAAASLAVGWTVFKRAKKNFILNI